MSLTIYQQPQNAIDLMLNALDSPLTKVSYHASIKQFLTWVAETQPLSPVEAVAEYKARLLQTLAPATINGKLSAVRAFFRAAADLDLIDQRTLSAITRISNVKTEGTKFGHWLTREQAQTLLNLPDKTARGCRDRALLAVFLGTALRVNEVAALTWGNIDQLTIGDETVWVFKNLSRKHGRFQTIPVPEWVMRTIFDYSAELRPEQKVFASLNRHGTWGESLTDRAIRSIIAEYGNKLGMTLGPHDLRRTWAFLAFEGGADLLEVQEILGHSKLETTRIYLKDIGILENTSIYRTGLTV